MEERSCFGPNGSTRSLVWAGGGARCHGLYGKPHFRGGIIEIPESSGDQMDAAKSVHPRKEDREGWDANTSWPFLHVLEVDSPHLRTVSGKRWLSSIHIIPRHRWNNCLRVYVACI
jgi:hypothetical protein